MGEVGGAPLLHPVAQLAERPGKLIALARAWARHDQPPSFASEEASARGLGASEADIEQLRQQFEEHVAAWVPGKDDPPLLEHPRGRGFEVFPENANAFRVFLAVSTQWEQPGMGGGRYTVAFSEVEIAMRALRIKRRADCFQRVQLMIRAARDLLIEKHNRELAEARSRRG